MKNYRNKYHAREVWHDGFRFPSTGEGDRYLYLKDCQRRGEISNLRLQVQFVFLPNIYERKTLKRGPRKGQTVDGKLLYYGVSYIADFVYQMPDGETVVEDFKGTLTPVFKIKQRMAVEAGFEIRVVKCPCEPVGPVHKVL